MNAQISAPPCKCNAGSGPLVVNKSLHFSKLGRTEEVIDRARQTTNETILGTVTDPFGGAVPDAIAPVTDMGTSRSTVLGNVGKIRAADTKSRQIQFGMKFMF